METEVQSEFVASLAAYVRLDEDSGQLTDSRDKFARDLLAKVSGSEVIQLMEASDLAAIFSGCITVRSGKELTKITSADQDQLPAMLEGMCSCHTLPLEAETGHPVVSFLAQLLESEEGCAMYRQIALMLAWGATQPELRPLLRTGKSNGQLEPDPMFGVGQPDETITPEEQEHDHDQ